jgi:2-(acetamidomethylene)succinate hydrolase
MTIELRTSYHPAPAGRLFAVAAGAGRPVICLHGITANAYVWLPVMERLAADFRVVAIDQRGHGRSDRPADAAYAARDFAADVVALIAALGGEPAILIGHSLGARNALAAAVAAPRDVAAVVAIDFVPFIGAPVFAQLAERVAGGDRRFATTAAVEDYLRQRYPRLPDDAVERRARYGYRRADDGGLVPLADAAAMAATCTGLAEDLAGTLAAVAVPTLLMRGAASRLVSPEAFRRARALRPDLAAIEIADADHYVPEEQPAAVVAAAASFLDRNPPARRAGTMASDGAMANG